MIFVWLFIYSIIYLISNYLSKTIGINHIITAPALLIFVILLSLIINQSKYKEDIKIKKFQFKIQDLALIVPLLCFALVNLIFVNNKFNFLSVLFVISTSAMVEIIFRGYLLTFLIKKSKKYSIYICAGIFALCHLVNFFKNDDVVFVIVQMICAFSVGLSYNAVTKKFDSIIIPFIISFITNLTALGSLSNVNFVYYICIAVCILINIGYFIYTIFDDKNKNSTETQKQQ